MVKLFPKSKFVPKSKNVGRLMTCYHHFVCNTLVNNLNTEMHQHNVRSYIIYHLTKLR